MGGQRPEHVESIDALIASVRAYNPKSDEDLLRAAYAHAERMHAGQTRRSGEPYITHPLAVAGILAEQRMDDATIATALLHDTVEDTATTAEEIERTFGPTIARLVEGVTKLTRMELLSGLGQAEGPARGDLKTREQAENFRKLIQAVAEDPRVLLVKLADRLHNMRTIGHMPPEKQRQKALETLEIYAPLAGRMGMQWMREELEDLAFKVLNPVARNSILKRVARLRRASGDLLDTITRDIEEVLARLGVEAEVTGREKRPYSIWRKMEERGEPFDHLSDIFGFRVITETVDDCYRVLGGVHQRWKAVPGRFKDYISQPKSNGYRSLHTTVSGRDGKRIEIQIRTRKMHEVAEAGVAAHWSYRDGVPIENEYATDPVRWVKELIEGLRDTEDVNEFLENAKLEMDTDKVFCFTPKGDVIKLPRGAMPLDFAYAIHTGIGDRCAGVKVDGKRVPLWTRLRNGQQVEIITAHGQRPDIRWLDLVVTGRAKAAIRRAIREQQTRHNISFGQQLARVAFEEAGRKLSDQALRTAAEKMGIDGENRAERLLERIGRGEITAQEVVRVLYPELAETRPSQEGVRAEEAIVGIEPGYESLRAPCCQPLPGERIIGIRRKDGTISIHAADCDALAEYEDGWIDLRWAPVEFAPVNEVTIVVIMANSAGVLGRICTLLGEQNANISDLVFVDKKPDFYRINITVEVRDIGHLHNILTSIEADEGVVDVERFRDPSLDRKPADAASEAAALAELGSGARSAAG